MVEERRLRQMINLARFKEKNKGTSFRVNKTYRSDYVGAALIGNFVLTTIAYFLLLLVIAVSNAEYILANLNNMEFRPLIAGLVIGYLVLLGIYSVITLTIAKIRYSRAEHNVAIYSKQLDNLKKMYREENETAEEKAIRAFEEGR